MNSISEYKKRIHSIETIGKITKSMELISTVKLKRIKESLDKSEEYYRTTFDILQKAFTKISKVELKTLDLPLFKDKIDKKLFILVNSNLGFCGGYNSNINKLLINEINKSKDEVFAIGRKAVAFCNSKKIKIFNQNTELSDYLLPTDIRSISSEVTSAFKLEKFDAIYMCYTKFGNSITYTPTITQVLPIPKESLLNNKENNRIPVEYEPDVKTVLESVLPLYLNSFLYGTILESKVSEQASRRNSMESATKNGKEMKDQLLLEANRVRQAKITTEISEIVSGAEAIGK